MNFFMDSFFFSFLYKQPVSDAPEGFPPTPPGWKRAQDKKSGRYYLYRGSETTWETDRNGQQYKK